jgi:hypothetical protein
MGIKKGQVPCAKNGQSSDDTVNEVFNQVSQSILDKSMMQQALPAEGHEAEREEAGTIDFPDKDESGGVPCSCSI